MVTYCSSISRRPSVRSSIMVLAAVILVINGCVGFKRYRRAPKSDEAVKRFATADDATLPEAKAELLTMGDGALPEMRDQFSDFPESGRMRIIELSATIGKPAPLLVEIFQEGAADSAPAVRQLVAFRAGSFPSMATELAPVLTPLLRDRVAAVRAAALSSLGAFPGTSYVQPKELARLTLDPDPTVASSAAAIAARQHELELRTLAGEALPRLIESLKNPEPSARAAAAFALGQYGPAAQSAVPGLTTLATRDSVPEVKLQAAVSLVRIDTPASKRTGLAVLRSFARTKKSPLRGAAESALRALNEPI